LVRDVDFLQYLLRFLTRTSDSSLEMFFYGERET